MGADLYFEEQNFRSLGYRFSWKKNKLILEQHKFYVGWTVVWSKVNPSDEEIAVARKITGARVPKKTKEVNEKSKR